MNSEHEHTVVTHLYHVKIPYHLKPQELQFETEPNKAPETSLMDLINDGYTDEEIRVVLRSTVLLLEAYPHRSLSDALHTSMVWLRG